MYIRPARITVLPRAHGLQRLRRAGCPLRTGYTTNFLRANVAAVTAWQTTGVWLQARPLPGGSWIVVPDPSTPSTSSWTAGRKTVASRPPPFSRHPDSVRDEMHDILACISRGETVTQGDMAALLLANP